MARLPLIDVIRPHFFVGMDLGPGVQEVLAALHVDDFDTAWDDDGVVLWGVARIDSDDPTSPVFSPRAGGGAVPTANRDDTGITWHDVAVRFRLTAARTPAAALPRAEVSDAQVGAVLDAYGPAAGAVRSDYPNTQFRLELLFELVDIPLPGLIGARLDGWVLVPDAAHPSVKLTVPRLLLILTQDSAADTDFRVDLGSFGAETMDDADPAIAALIGMTPPHALFPGEQFGFGLQKVVLDLSAERTPPDILDRFGVGEDWKGLYVPELRFFVSTQRAAGVAFNVGAREMLIGFEPTAGLWGDFNFDVDVLGDTLAVDLRVYGVNGERFYPARLVTEPDRDRYQITLPTDGIAENHVLFVDVTSGAAPFTMRAISGQPRPADLDVWPEDAAFTSGEDISVLQRLRLFSPDQRVAVLVTTRNPRQRRLIVLDVYPGIATGASTTASPARLPVASLSSSVPGAVGRVSLQDADREEVRLVLDPPGGTLTVGGSPVPVVDGVARVRLPAGETRPVVASWAPAAPRVARLVLFFGWNLPSSDPHAVANREGVVPGPDFGTLDPAAPVPIHSDTGHTLQSFVDAWRALPVDGRLVQVDGLASYGTQLHADRNNPLSVDRARVLASVLQAAGITGEIPVQGWSNDRFPPLTDLVRDVVPGNASAYARGSAADPRRHQVAIASLYEVLPADRYEGTLTRGAPLPPDDRRAEEPPAPQGEHPDWLRHLGGTVRFERDAVPVAGELRLTVDFQTAHEDGLQAFRTDLSTVGPGFERPEEQARLPQGDPNPDDGVVEFRFTITHDPTSGTFTETLVARAAEGDRDGLWSWGAIPNDEDGEPASDGWRDLLGLYFALSPLLATTAADATSGGDVVPLVVGLTAPIVVTALGVAHVLRFTHHGVELAARHDADEFHLALLFDVESAIWVNLKLSDNFEIVTTRPDKPIKVRYKATGFALDVNPDGSASFTPVFDPSRGYTLDLADSGSLRVLPTLGDAVGDIIQVLGARIARTNPLQLEVDLGLGVDLGVISVDRFGFRLPIDPLGDPTITAIRAGVDIPGALKGTGYLEIRRDGFAGQLDLTLTSVGLRIAGALAVRTLPEATAVLVTLAVELPGGIPLGGTGLSLFGLLGLFAMHHRRTESTTARNPALDWLVSVNGDPTDLRGWTPAVDQWAFGVGLVAGTIEGGTVLNLKGMLVLELPGPRVVLFVHAGILSPKPETSGTGGGTLSAVVDISPQRVLIGILFEYEIEAVLELRVPIEAGFFYDPPEHFYVDVGTVTAPVTATILELFEATAYFMVHGDGIEQFPLGALQGFSIATGFRVSFTWGNTDIGLYIRVAAGFDAGIGFAPLFFAGRVFLEGELRLFIIGIGVSARLLFLSDGTDTRLEGAICGRIDLFFFSIEACVGFALGNVPGVPEAPALLRDLKLQSRSPALVDGTGVDRGIDDVLCHGTADGSVPVAEVREGDAVVSRPVYVPIDAIPLLELEVAPQLADDAVIDGQPSSGLPAGAGDGWQKRGERYLRYTVGEIRLRLVAVGGVPVPDGTPATTPGPRPFTWRHLPQEPGGDALTVHLAMLDWKPTNADKVLVQGPALDALVDSRWGDVCAPVADPAPALWTFRGQRTGPDPAGWSLRGEAWPDAPGARRSRPVPIGLRVTETWRTGTLLDGLVPAVPAEVVEAATDCPDGSEPGPCLAKVLEAPYEALVAHTGHTGELRKTLDAIEASRAGELRDALRLSGGPFVELTALVFVRTKMLMEGLLSARALDAAGHELPADIEIERIVPGVAVPWRWEAGSGPWWDDVALARAWFGEMLAANGEWSEALVRVKGTAGPVAQVDLGVQPLSAAIGQYGMDPPAWFLAAAEGLAQSEVERAEPPEPGAPGDPSGLPTALGDRTHALLLPNAEYRVEVSYTAEVGAKPTDPLPGEDADAIVPQRDPVHATAGRTFFTDAEPPRSLDPWMLAQSPSAAEGFHFTDDPVVFAFGTDDVLELYAAYGRALRGVARAASFQGSAGTPEAAQTHLLLAPWLERLPGVVLSPWEATVRHRLAGQPCLDYDPDAARHGRVALPFLLFPQTDYVVDLEALDEAGEVALPAPRPGDVGRRPLFRHAFTTSRYRNRGELAEAVRTSLPTARTVPAGSFADLGERVSDEAFDLALHQAGLPVVGRPTEPRVTALWTAEAPARAVAVLIETPEPLWRTRTVPTPEYDDTGEHIVRWVLAPAAWLEVDELVRASPVLVKDGGGYVRRATGSQQFVTPTLAQVRAAALGPKPPPPPPVPVPVASLVARLVRDDSGTRTLVVLNPGVRGQTVSLGLARTLHPLLDTETTDTPTVLLELELAGPPWERG